MSASSDTLWRNKLNFDLSFNYNNLYFIGTGSLIYYTLMQSDKHIIGSYKESTKPMWQLNYHAYMAAEVLTLYMHMRHAQRRSFEILKCLDNVKVLHVSIF